MAAASSSIQYVVNADNLLKACINDRNTPYRITATLELIVDGIEVEIPANIGNTGECQRTMYTLSDDRTIYAGWEEEYPFEIRHFLWMWGFSLRDMVQDRSGIFVNGQPSPHFTNHPFIYGAHYTAVFTSKDYDTCHDEEQFLAADANWARCFLENEGDPLMSDICEMDWYSLTDYEHNCGIEPPWERD